MLLKIILKIWPSLIPMFLYALWVFVQQLILNKIKNKGVIDGDFEEVGKKNKSETLGHFSLRNPRFMMVIYLSLIFLIVSFLFFLLQSPHITEGKYVPAKIEGGKIVPGKIVQ